MNIFGNLGKMGEMLKQAKQLKDEMSRARYTADVGGVLVTVNGEMEIVDLKLPANVQPNQVKDAVNKAMREAKMDMAQKMQKMTGGMGGMPGLPGM